MHWHTNMSLNPKLILSGSLACLLMSAPIESRAGVGYLGGDFEAKLVVQQEGVPITPVLVSVTIAPSTTAPKFSGKVTSGSVSQTIAGAFVQAEEGFTATISGLKGLPAFVLSYSPMVTNPIDETTSEVVESERFSVRLLGSEQEEVLGRPCVFLLNDYDNQPWSLKDAFAGVMQTSGDSFAEIDGKIELIDGQVLEVSDSVLSLKADLSSFTAAVKSAESNLAAVNKAAATAKSKASTLLTAKANTVKLRDALEKVTDAGALALDKALVTAGALSADELAEISAGEEMSGPGEELLNAMSYFIGDKMFNEGATNAEALAALIAQLKPVTSATSVAALEDAMANLSIATPDFSALSEQTDAKRLSLTKAFFTVVTTQATAFNKAFNDLLLAEAKEVQTFESLDPSVLEDLEVAEQQIAEATDGLAMAKADLQSRNDEIAGLEAKKAILASSRAMLVAAKSLSGFGGFGTYTGAVTGPAYKPTGAPSPVTVAIAGTTPDGQKFSYSTKLRQGESGDAFLINAVAGKNPIVFDVNYAIDSEAKSGEAYASEESSVFWAGINAYQTVGSALFPAKVSDVEREDNGRSVNIFGGPIGEDGLVSTAATATQSVLVSFGYPDESASINGFGAAITNANKAAKLLVARKGSTFTLTPSATTAPTFSGVYPFVSGAAKPSSYSGVFLRVNGDNGPSVKGFGSLVVSPTRSEPVEVSTDLPSEDGGVPQTPGVPEREPIVWSGFSTGGVSFQISDMPESLNITTLILFKGSKEVGRAQADASGLVTIPSKGLAKGSDYSIQVVRETISDVYPSERSEQFEIDVRTLPAYTYQTLLSAESTRNGMPSQGRLTVTTTATGSWSGNLEWVSLTQVRDASGEILDGFIPTGKKFTLKGQLAAANPADPSELSSVVTIPSVKGATGHVLSVAVKDFEIQEAVTALPTTTTALQLECVFQPDGTEGEAEGAQYFGQGVPSVKALAAAKGNFSTVSVIDGNVLSNHSHLIAVSGAATALYTFQNGSLGKLTSTGNLLMDGTVPVLATGSMGRYSLSYTNSANKKVTASMAMPSAVVTSVRLSSVVDDSGAKPVTRYTATTSNVAINGAELEVAAKSPGGHVYRDDWADISAPRNGIGGFGFAGQVSTIPTKRYVDFSLDEKFVVGNSYRLEILTGSGSDLVELWSGGLTLDAKGVATIEEFSSMSATARPVSFTVAPTTGVMTANVKVGTVDGEVVFNPTGGRAVKLTGFALPSNDASVLGWGGVEGGNLSWRLRSN